MTASSLSMTAHPMTATPTTAHPMTATPTTAHPAPPVSTEVEKALRNYPKEDVVDGCAAAAHVAYACSDAAFIYPITPSSAMAEVYEVWAAHNRRNIFGDVCVVRQLQSEAGAAGAVHGSLSVGAVTTTFTASQGLLLMIPPMYKIAGELIPCVFHVSARAIAGQALSIFGDHSDVMAVRQCGWTMLSSASVQEAQDLALISHMATLLTKVPVVHFFDGFRTSHELQKIKMLDYWTIREMIDFDAIQNFRQRSLNPTHPHSKGASQGPEVYFQNVEVANRYYLQVPEVVEQCMAVFGEKIGRHYKLFEYYGAEDAEDVLVVMGAGGPVIEQTVDYMAEHMGRKGGLVTVKLFRPWKLERFIDALPKSVKRICVLDRTKEPGALGEPLYLDVASSLQASGMDSVKCVHGRFGLGSKDFNPAMVLAVFDNLRDENSKRGFTVGIEDDLTKLSLCHAKYSHVETVPEGTTQCMFWGMGSDGTVGANKNVIKILGMNTPLQVQGYFAYSAHKAGGLTVSHLRFGPAQIKSQYLLQSADYIAVHREVYIHKYHVLEAMKENGTFVLNTNLSLADIEKDLPGQMKREMAEKNVRCYIIDANKVAAENGMGRRINNVLMTAFFKLSGVLPFEEAIALFKSAIQKTYGKKGKHVVEANWKCVDAAVDAVQEVQYDKAAWLQAGLDKKAKEWVNTAHISEPPSFVQGVMLALERMDGEKLPTSAFREFEGGVIPPGTAGYEKRGIALNVPIVDMDKCTQCNQCAFVCPHAAIRPFLLEADEEENAPTNFVTKKCKGPAQLSHLKFRIQVSPFDCTGCELCYIACPDDALKMIPLADAEPAEQPNWDFAINLADRSDELDVEQRMTLKGSQFYQPMVEFSGACEGCGETPYVKLLTQLFGERLIIANATGCSSIWAASYPANAYTVNQKGLGPAWGNSLFEDNAEYGYGMAVATAHRRQRLRDSVEAALQDEAFLAAVSSQLRASLSRWLLQWLSAPACQQAYLELKELLPLEAAQHPTIRYLDGEKDLFPKISQWIIGGDGWAYDIGFGGVDHVIASGVDINFLILDTEVYSNTGGQQSKATTMGAVHKFATGGRLRNKKDFGAMAMEYGDVYVASIASSANMTQTVRAFIEAEAYEGPAILLAYSPCIEHQYIKPFNLQIEHCKLAVDSGYWPLYRYNPALIEQGQNPFQLDSRKIKASIVDLLKKENRFGTLRRANPALAAELEAKLQQWATERFEKYRIKALGVQALSAEKPLDGWNVVYGSETGNAEDLAKRVSAMLKERDLAVTVSQMDELSLDDFAAMQKVVLICSTAGQGEFPGNAKGFYEMLNAEKNPHLLDKMQFGVLGLGDSAYVFFNSAAKAFDAMLAQLGGHRILDIGLGDDQAEEGYETAAAEWLSQFWTETKIGEPKNVSPLPAPSQFEVITVTAGGDETQPCQHHTAAVIKLVKNERMTPADYEVDVRHLEFDLSGTSIKYALGDSLALWPRNEDSAVSRFCEHFEFNPDQWVKVQSATKAGLPTKYSKLFEQPLTVRKLLTECVDIFGKPSRSFYEVLWKYCTAEEEAQAAKVILSKDHRDTLLQWTQHDTVTYFDLLKKFASTRPNVSLTMLLDTVPLLKPRYYSIASSQKYVGQNNLHLCVGIVDWTTASGEYRMGECTGFLARTECSVATPAPLCATIKATAFQLPPSEMHPIIVAGMGTGLAPFRAFIQHKAWLKQQNKQCGPLSVFFGCRYSKKDYLYGAEMEQYKREGVITDLFVAFSRDQKQKHYIQHDIQNNKELFYQRMVTEDGYFYLCGSAKQVPIDVRNAVRRCLMDCGDMSEVSAEELITNWQIKGKYNVEAWS